MNFNKAVSAPLISVPGSACEAPKASMQQPITSLCSS